MTWGRYVFYRRDNRELQILSEGDIAHAFEPVKQHYGRMAAGSAICEFLDHITEDEDRNPLLFSIVLEALQWVGRIAEIALDVPGVVFPDSRCGCGGVSPPSKWVCSMWCWAPGTPSGVQPRPGWYAVRQSRRGGHARAVRDDKFYGASTSGDVPTASIFPSCRA